MIPGTIVTRLVGAAMVVSACCSTIATEGHSRKENYDVCRKDAQQSFYDCINPGRHHGSGGVIDGNAASRCLGLYDQSVQSCEVASRDKPINRKSKPEDK